jgi:hypothetical protein
MAWSRDYDSNAAGDAHTPHQHHDDQEGKADGDAKRQVGCTAQGDSDVEREERRAGAAREDDDHGREVKQILDCYRRDRRPSANAPLYKGDLRWLTDEDAKRRDIGERLSHQCRAEGCAERQPERIIEAHPPGDGAQKVPDSTERADHDEPPTDAADTVKHSCGARSADGPEKQQGSAPAARPERRSLCFRCTEGPSPARTPTLAFRSAT